MKATKATIAAWSREDLVRTAVAMMNIAGWALALVLVAYILRFGLPASLQLRMYGAETTEQLLNAKAAWGQFGEFVGGTFGPLVSLLALVALVFTVLLQQEAMIRAQSDTDLSKQALAKQTRLTLETAARVKVPVASIMQPMAEYVRGAKPLRRPSHVPG